MAKLLSSIKRFIGESGERKAMDCPNGSTFLETDTGNMYVFVEDDWHLKEEANIALRMENKHLILELLEQAKKTNEFLETIASATND